MSFFKISLLQTLQTLGFLKPSRFRCPKPCRHIINKITCLKNEKSSKEISREKKFTEK